MSSYLNYILNKHTLCVAIRTLFIHIKEIGRTELSHLTMKVYIRIECFRSSLIMIYLSVINIYILYYVIIKITMILVLNIVSTRLA